ILTGHHQVRTGLKRVVQRGRSIGKLDLGPVVNRLDDSDAWGGRNIDGLRGRQYLRANRKPESPHVAPCRCYPNRLDRGSRTASRGATRRRGRALGGGILVAWRAQLADRCNPLLCRLDEHTRRFGADARAPLAADGRTGGDGRYAAVRHQYSLHLRDDAGLLATHDPPPPSLIVDPDQLRRQQLNEARKCKDLLFPDSLDLSAVNRGPEWGISTHSDHWHATAQLCGKAGL